jgi:hypothetical protein
VEWLNWINFPMIRRPEEFGDRGPVEKKDHSRLGH